ncbi:MAG: hypothetical protein HYY18_11710 [Planctomycetes bacterium]|nr:hypothetical protein [Planctomycetota bacterium]
MQRIDDREAVVRLARVILGQGERTAKEDSVLGLLFQMCDRDDEAKKGERKYVRRGAKRIARTA